MDLHQCFDSRRKFSPFVEENGYSDSFHSGADNWLAFWLYLVTSSYFLLRENVDFFSGSRIKSQENVSLCNKSTPNDTIVVDDAISYSESLGSPYSTCSSIYFDAYSEISDFDRTSYWHSLVSLEEEDSEWLSDSLISENPSTPLSYNSGSFSEFSDVDAPGYWDSLLNLEGEDSEWNLDKVSYWLSLLNLEDEDSEWLSDSMTSENPSSPLSYSGDSFIEFSDVDSYWDSLLNLDKEEDQEWISNSKQDLELVLDGSPMSSYKINWGTVVLPPISTVSSFSGTHSGKLEDVFSAEHLIKTEDIEEFNGDGPLYWPFEGKFDWDYEESSFCNSPRKRLVFGSNMDIPLEYFALDQEFAIETLVGLKEFDGHEGLDYEFIGNGFMLEKFLQ